MHPDWADALGEAAPDSEKPEFKALMDNKSLTITE